MNSVTRTLLCIILFTGFAAFNWFCSRKQSATVQTYAGLSDSARYVGMNTCKGCHPNVHDTYIHTGMGQSFDIAHKAKSSADFSQHPVIYDEYRDFYYAPSWENDSLVFLEFRLEGKDTVYKRKETISYIVGSGQHTNSHIWQSNGFLYQAPMTFYTQKQQWDLPPGFQDGNNTRFSRTIGLECMSCHNAYPKFEIGSENKYSFVNNGIDCERCHGPGSIHVKEKTEGILIDTSLYIDYSIVNPSKLPVDLQLDVCQRCHIQGNAVLNEGKSFFDFKPGMKLSDVMNVFMPVYQGREDEHIMASHAERLKMSPCYQVTLQKIESAEVTDKLRPYKNALTCVTCHNPHVSVKQTNYNHFNQVCGSCHTGNKEPLCKEDKNILEKANYNCVNCHMRLNDATDIPHVSVHDHKISVPPPVSTIPAEKKFVGISSINNPNPPDISIAEAYINYAEKFGLGPAMLDSALSYIPKGTKDNIRKNIILLIHVYFLKSEYSKVVSYAESFPELMNSLNQVRFDNRHAWTSYRIGESYSNLNNEQAALIWYRNANKLAPLHSEFANKYGTALASVGNTQEALNVFEKLASLHPEFAPGLSNLGYLKLIVNNDKKSASELYDRALALDPDYAGAMLNKTGLYLANGEISKAKQLLNKILKKYPDNAQAKSVLEQLK